MHWKITAAQIADQYDKIIEIALIAIKKSLRKINLSLCLVFVNPVLWPIRSGTFTRRCSIDCCSTQDGKKGFGEKKLKMVDLKKYGAKIPYFP